jgi:hypothetical protein
LSGISFIATLSLRPTRLRNDQVSPDAPAYIDFRHPALTGINARRACPADTVIGKPL